jgi:hypothetical protein
LAEWIRPQCDETLKVSVVSVQWHRSSLK